MTHRPHAPVPVPRAILLAAAAALAATALSHLVGWAVSQYLDSVHDTPDANIGAGLALILLPVPLAPVLAWPLVRTVRLPHPALTTLLGALLYLPLAVGAWGLWASALDGTRVGSLLAPVLGSVWSLAAAEAVALAVALAASAVLTTRHHARALRER
ncbi:transporter [Nocardiopsis sp. TSRI0078]|uniref:transporter n=1 Tax=unclassified Nocardiopsis TaxID=2649073 RepID=UPI00093A9DAA|nr:transporter [Nocardiopsis sp. TSRI0078]OKI22039.1 transporter [Nocardiopsis sp. TSRI0078]